MTGTRSEAMTEAKSEARFEAKSGQPPGWPYYTLQYYPGTTTPGYTSATRGSCWHGHRVHAGSVAERESVMGLT